MMSDDMKRANLLAEEYDKKLQSTDPRFCHSVRIIHEEGTVLAFNHAFIMRWKDPAVEPGGWGAIGQSGGVWVIVFTEHHGFHLYPRGDLYDFAEYQRISAEGWFGVPPKEEEEENVG